MSVSNSSAANVMSAAASTSTSNKLVKLANGEYTAASVGSDQTDANKLGLQKEKDGNYGTSSPTAMTTTGSATAQSSSSVQEALSSLTLGGS